MDTNDKRETYRVPDQNLDELLVKVAKLNKRAAKLGVAGVVVTELGEEFEWRTVKNRRHYEDACPRSAHNPCCYYQQRFVNLSVVGETPKIDGWRLVAVLDHKAEGVNLLRAVPGETVPERYWSAKPLCEHCKTKRTRRDTVVLGHDDGAYIQVGKTCLADFLGGADPAQLASMAELFRSFEDAAGGDPDGYDGFGDGHEPKRSTAFAVLVAAATAIRLHGWAPAKSEGKSTKSRVAEWLFPRTFMDKGRTVVIDGELEPPTDGDRLTAFETLQWVNAMNARSDYEHNLRATLACGSVRVREDLGIAASAVSAYQRYLGRQVEYAQKQKRNADLGNAWMGTVGKRETFDLTVLDVKVREGDYGPTTIVKFVDAENNLATWFASGFKADDYKAGQTVKVKATVKRHGEFNGKPETYLTRVA